MIRLRVVSALVGLALVLGIMPAAQAQTISSVLTLNYWPTSHSLALGGPLTWNTNFVYLTYRGTFDQWGVHLQGAFGNQSNWSAAITSGNDTIWSADVFYAFQMEGFVVRPFLGYGAAHSFLTDGVSTATLDYTGFRIGADVSFPIMENLTANAGVAYTPSANVTIVSGGTINVPGTALDWDVNLQYAFDAFLAQAGYRAYGGTIGGGCVGCSFQWTGWYVGLGYKF